MKNSVNKSIVWIVLPYVLFASLWILLSDRFLEALPLDAAAHTRISIFKGWAFVAVTALLLAALLRAELKARHSVEIELSRANRALRTTGDCSQLLVRTDDSSALLHGVCRLLIERGGYRMAWVGLAESDESMTIRPIAQAGFTEGYLESVKFTWADVETGPGPSGTAIRTGRHVVARNIPDNPAYGPWRAAAIQRGYASSIALPLISEGRPFGVLNVYSSEADAFDPAEIELLEELANDLAYGMNALQLRAARNETEKALRENEERYRRLVQVSPDAIFVNDTGRISFINDAGLKLLGASDPGQVIGRNALEFFHPAYREFIQDRIKAMIQDKKAVPVAEEQVLRLDGTCVDVEVVAAPFEYRGSTAIQVIMHDITERKRAEAALRESEERLRIALEAAHMGTYDWDMRTDRITWSELHERLWGFKPGEFDGTYHHFATRVHPDDLQGLNAEVTRCIANHEPFQREYRVIRPDGSVHWILGLGEFGFAPDGKVTRMTGVVLETTVRREAEERLTRSREQLRALLARFQRLREEERTRMAREVHDVLGQLLTGIKMDISWWERRFAKITDVELRQSMEKKIETTTHLVDTMIETVQKISRELRPSVLDNIGLGAALQFETRQFQERTGIACEVSAPMNGLAVNPDHRTGIFRVFQELLTNVARHAGASKVTVSLTRTETEIVLKVTDNGRGIREEELSDPASLGLLGMSERAALMGGKIDIRSVPGQGTTATLIVPADIIDNAK